VYARGGVPEVWIVDLAARRILRSASPRNGVFTESELLALGAGESIGIGALPDIRIDAQALFPS
jgi:hypothetical protein